MINLELLDTIKVMVTQFLSSIINGYDENNLKKYCDYPAIIKYLIKNKNKKHIKYFNVTKIFSNNKIISKKNFENF